MEYYVDRKTEITYEVHSYMSEGVYSTLKEARIKFKQVMKDYGQGGIVKRIKEYTTIETEQVIQGGR